MHIYQNFSLKIHIFYHFKTLCLFPKFFIQISYLLTFWKLCWFSKNWPEPEFNCILIKTNITLKTSWNFNRKLPIISHHCNPNFQLHHFYLVKLLLFSCTFRSSIFVPKIRAFCRFPIQTLIFCLGLTQFAWIGTRRKKLLKQGEWMQAVQRQNSMEKSCDLKFKPKN